MIRLDVTCSSGTYIRALAADIGTALGGGAHLRNLRRVASAGFTVDEAVPLDAATVDSLLPPAAAMRGYASAVVDDGIAAAVAVGKVLERDALGVEGDGPWAVLDGAGALLAVYETYGGSVKPAVVLTELRTHGDRRLAARPHRQHAALAAQPRAPPGLTCTVAAKLEMTNPGGSVKDRPAVAMIDAAEREGLLKPGGTIVEPTSGNTGVGLAIVAAQRGYRCIFVMTDKVAPEKVALLRAYGAEVVVCPVAVEPEDPQSYYSVAERLVQRDRPARSAPTSTRTSGTRGPTSSPPGPRSGARPPAASPTSSPASAPAARSPASAATSRRMSPAVQIVGADPAGSVYSGGSGRPYLVEGIGEDFWPTTYDPSLVDRVVADQRRGLVPHGPPGHPRGGPPHRRLGRHRRGRRHRGRPRAGP